MRHGKAALPGPDTRARVLAAAEHLLARDGNGFAMRELAAQAGVSFATPFNLFGSKGAILQALSAERIARMSAGFMAVTTAPGAPARVLAAVDVAVAVMLDAPLVNRAVMGALGTPLEEPGEVSRRSRDLWAMALGTGQGLRAGVATLACAVLPDQLAVAFRGVLSFWSAGEIADAALRSRARQAAAALLLGFADESGAHDLLGILRPE